MWLWRSETKNITIYLKTLRASSTVRASTPSTSTRLIFSSNGVVKWVSTSALGFSILFVFSVSSRICALVNFGGFWTPVNIKFLSKFWFHEIFFFFYFPYLFWQLGIYFQHLPVLKVPHVVFSFPKLPDVFFQRLLFLPKNINVKKFGEIILFKS